MQQTSSNSRRARRPLPRRPSELNAASAAISNPCALDLNLLRLLDAIVQEGSLTGAGRKLGLSQPATSHALARLRHMSGNELFVRTPDGMQPTPWAHQIAGPIREALRVLSAALEPEHFDPAHSARGFTLLANNYAARGVIPILSRKIAAAAPGVALHVQPTSARDVLDQLDAGGVDVALTRLVNGGERFKCVRVADDDYVALLDPQNPVATLGQLTCEHLARIPPAIVTSDDDDTGFLADALGDIGLSRKTIIRVPLFSMFLMLVGSHRLAVLPRRPANSLAAVSPLIVKELPFASPRTELFMIWHRGLDNVPAQRWLRSMIRDCVLE